MSGQTQTLAIPEAMATSVPSASYENVLKQFATLLKECEEEFRTIAREQERAQVGGMWGQSNIPPEEWVYRKGSVGIREFEALQTIFEKAREMKFPRKDFIRLLTGYFADPEDQKIAQTSGKETLQECLLMHSYVTTLTHVNRGMYFLAVFFLLMAIDNETPLKEWLVMAGGGSFAIANVLNERDGFTPEWMTKLNPQDASKLINIMGQAAAQMGFGNRARSVSDIIEQTERNLRALLVMEVLEQATSPESKKLCRGDILMTLDYPRTLHGKAPTPQEKELQRKITSPEIRAQLEELLPNAPGSCKNSASADICWEKHVANSRVASTEMTP